MRAVAELGARLLNLPRRKAHRIALLPALVLLSACAQSGVTPVTTVDVPARYAHGPASASAPGPAASAGGASTDPAARGQLELLTSTDVRTEAAWWQAFGDPRLDTLIGRALAANPNLAAAGLLLERARLQAGLSAVALQPVLSGSAGRTSSRIIGQGGTQSSTSANVGASWEIDLWGRLRAQRDVAAWEAQATAEDLAATRLALIAQLCRSYWQLAYLNQSIDVGMETLARLARTRELVAVQRRAGAVSLLEVDEADQNIERQQVSQSALLQQREALRSSLGVLLGGELWPVADEPVDLDAVASPVPRPGLPSELLARRPDLRAAELRLREALSQIQATARSYYPAFSLTGSLGKSSDSLSSLIRNPVATLGAGVTLPFLNIQQARYSTRIVDKSYEIAAAQFRGTLLAAFGEVDTALSARQQLALQLEAASRSLATARLIEQRYAVRYRAGAVSLRIWLDAQQTLREAELSLAQTRLSLINNDVSLFEVLGGAW